MIFMGGGGEDAAGRRIVDGYKRVGNTLLPKPASSTGGNPI
jgi:hypothetical protein